MKEDCNYSPGVAGVITEEFLSHGRFTVFEIQDVLAKGVNKMPARGSIEINELYCKGCELCVAACPQHGIALAMDYLTPRGYHPARLVSDKCTGCEICGIVCPDAAITVFRQSHHAPAKGG